MIAIEKQHMAYLSWNELGPTLRFARASNQKINQDDRIWWDGTSQLKGLPHQERLKLDPNLLKLIIKI